MKIIMEEHNGNVSLNSITYNSIACVTVEPLGAYKDLAGISDLFQFKELEQARQLHNHKTYPWILSAQWKRRTTELLGVLLLPEPLE